MSTIDPPPAAELLSLVAAFLADELAPAQPDAKLRYRTLAAANLLRIACRELETLAKLQVDADGYAVPPELIEAAGSLRAFTADLAQGRRSLVDPVTFDLVSRYVEAKLAVAAPEALAPRPADSKMERP